MDSASSPFQRYSYRSASIGESLDALTAGATPNITPTKTEKKNAKKTDHGVTLDIKNIETKIDTPIPKRMPIIPPLTDRIIASSRNCLRMSDRFAPNAFRSPISRVRSVTETSIIFATPIPPTKRAIDAIHLRQ